MMHLCCVKQAHFSFTNNGVCFNYIAHVKNNGNIYSAIHKAASSLVTGHSLQNSKNMTLAGMTLRDHSPIHTFTDFQELYQSNHGTAGNREAVSFVNSGVSLFFSGTWTKMFPSLMSMLFIISCIECKLNEVQRPQLRFPNPMKLV